MSIRSRHIVIKRYYDVLKEVDAMDGIDINGMTVWGVIDKYSWLQDSNSAGGVRMVPRNTCLFCSMMITKQNPRFTRLQNDTRLEPYINNVVVMQALGEMIRMQRVRPIR